jgi:glycosyltransferase involved in cell wall biosynthesis
VPDLNKHKTLHLFTINFPLTNEEVFLYNEILYLAKSFKTILIFPLQSLEKESVFILPENVKVVKFNVYQPFNRLKVAIANIGIIAGIYFKELVHSNNRFKYLSVFSKTLNNLTHKIAVADKLFNELDNSKQNKIVYTYWFNQWTLILAVMQKKHGDLNLYTRIHGMDVYEEQHLEKDFFFQFRYFQLQQIKAVLAISENGKKHLSNMNSNAAYKTIVSRLGVIDKGINSEDNAAVFRIVSCSAFQKYKRVHLIIDILKKIEINVEWVHFGDGELKNDVLTKSKDISFKWMGSVKNELVLNYFSSNYVNLFINVSETEGIPVSIMEAISFGIPIIAPNVGGIAEIVNEQTGYLIEKNFDPEYVAAIIEKHFNLNKNEIKILRKRCRDFWALNYSAEKNYDQLNNLLAG